MKLFVSSDIHGHFDEWQRSLKLAGFDINNNEHHILLCGDIFDRGRQPKQIIEFILSIKDRVIIVKGNHESLMEEMIKRNKSDIGDLLNGTSQTIVDLYPDWLITEFNLSNIAKETHISEILDMCIDFYETKDYIFVHGWIPTIDGCLYDKDWRNASVGRWEKARWCNPLLMSENKIYEPNKKIVFGHWHCSAFWHRDNPLKYDELGENAVYEPFISKHYISIDACTTRSKKVNCLVIDVDENT